MVSFEFLSLILFSYCVNAPLNAAMDHAEAEYKVVSLQRHGLDSLK